MGQAKNADDEAIIKAFATNARSEMLREFPKRNNCIQSTVITVVCLNRFGIKTVPIAVKLVVRAKNLGYSTCIGGISGQRHSRGLWKGSFAAHMVAVLPQHKLLIDSSIDQVQLPKCDIPAPLLLPVSSDFCKPYESVEYPPIEAPDATFSLEDFEGQYRQDRIPESVRKAMYADDRCIKVIEHICDKIRQDVK